MHQYNAKKEKTSTEPMSKTWRSDVYIAANFVVASVLARTGTLAAKNYPLLYTQRIRRLYKENASPRSHEWRVE